MNELVLLELVLLAARVYPVCSTDGLDLVDAESSQLGREVFRRRGRDILSKLRTQGVDHSGRRRPSKHLQQTQAAREAACDEDHKATLLATIACMSAMWTRPRVAAAGSTAEAGGNSEQIVCITPCGTLSMAAPGWG